MIIAGKNIIYIIITSLRRNNYIYSIKEPNRGITDFTITELSLRPPRIILTRDTDFGDLAFLYKVPTTGCILLRYNPIYEELVLSKLIFFLNGKKNG